VTRCGGASFAPSPVPQRIALVVDSGTEINELLDGVFASENWSVQRVHAIAPPSALSQPIRST
jgi:hypothetical protein